MTVQSVDATIGRFLVILDEFKATVPLVDKRLFRFEFQGNVVTGLRFHSGVDEVGVWTHGDPDRL